MKRDLIVEVICQAICDVYYEATRIKSITSHPPTPDSQLLTIEDHDGAKFSIEIKVLKD